MPLEGPVSKVVEVETSSCLIGASIEVCEGTASILPLTPLQVEPSRAKDWGSDLTPKKTFTMSSMKANDLRTKANTCYASSSSGKETRRTELEE